MSAARLGTFSAVTGQTRLVCETCQAAFLLDADTIVAAAEIEAFVDAHTDCGGTLRVEMRQLA
jgi:hypothetical protein